MKLKFCGADREVTGSSHLITLDDGFTILLDCGLYQGSDEKMADFNSKWLFDPAKIDCLVLSHAHIDHTGRVPKFVADGFRGKIFATSATRDLTNLLLLDSAKIQENDAEYDNKKIRKFDGEEKKPLYTLADAQEAMKYFVGYNYEQWFHVHPDVRVIYRDAGHILGSASVFLEIKCADGNLKTIAFTGDIGRPNRPILGDPLPMLPADYVICESTYGDREHESGPNEIEHFLKIVNHCCVEKKGKLIIPAFSVGRTQEIVYILDKLNAAGRLPKIPVFVDSPMSANATEIFANHPECFDADIHKHMTEDANPFGFNTLYYIRDAENSKKLNTIKKPSIIISASGMMNAGRIRHHLFNNIENPRNTFLIVGYCSPDTPGGKLRAGDKSIYILGKNKQVLADIEVMDSFSAHGDRSEMTDFLINQKDSCKKMFLVHGTIDRQEKWREHLLNVGFKDVQIPELGTEIEI